MNSRSVTSRLPAIAVALFATLALAACGSSPTPSPSGPAAAGDVTVGPSPSLGASAALSPTASASPSATQVPLPALKLLWQKACPSSVQTETYWPAIDPLTGDVWVASSFQDEYWIFRPDGTCVGTFGSSGSGPGQFHLTTHDPHPDGVGAIAFAPDGSFYVADNGNYRVEVFDKRHNFVKAWGSLGTGPGQFVSPKAIATDGKVVYVGDDGRHDVQVFDTSGHYLRSFDGHGSFGFSLSPKGLLVLADDDDSAIVMLDSTGKVVAQHPVDFASFGPDAAQVGSATGGSLAIVEPNGRILVGLANDSGPVGLLEVDPSGRVVRAWSTGGETLALAPDGKSIYEAYTGPSLSGWPYFRKYALPPG